MPPFNKHNCSTPVIQTNHTTHRRSPENQDKNDGYSSSSITCDTSDSSGSSPDYASIKRKKKKWSLKSFSFNHDLESHQPIASDRHVIHLFLIFGMFFLLQVWGFRTAARFKGLKPWLTFNTVNPNMHWCPKATCNNSPMCEPCKRKFLIVIATGRSGSTTLTNMIDLLPGVRMAGENNGHLAYGLDAMKNLKSTESFRLESKREVVGAWRHNPIPKQSMACPIQNIFENMNPPPEKIMNLRNGFDDTDEIIGFKTVQFHNAEDFGPSHVESTDFLIETFPCAKFVINIRGDIEAQRASWLKAFGTEMDGEAIREYNRRLENVAAHLGQDRARLIDMSEWSRRDGSGLYVLNELIEWLGFEGCNYPSLMHSNKDGYGIDTKKYFLGENCKRISQ